MGEVNKDLLRKLAAALLEIKEEEDYEAFDDWQEATHPWKILPLLDENAAQAARIAELERECERLRGPEEAVTSARGDKLFTFMSKDPCRYQLCEVTYAAPVRKLIEERDFLRAELEACRKDAERWRYMRDSEQPLDPDVFSAINEWLWASGDIADVALAIDAAMKEGGV